MKHPHAELMALYAKDALETDTPYLYWQVQKKAKEKWYNLTQHPTWSVDDNYRTKKISWNDYTFVQPITVEEAQSLEKGIVCYVVDLTADNFGRLELCVALKWSGKARDFDLVKRNIVHLTEASATRHAYALLKENGKQLGLLSEQE